MGKSKKSMGKNMMVGVILIFIVVVFFFYTERKARNPLGIPSRDMTEAEKLISKDLDENYPETPREVLKLYSRILTCLYEGRLSSEEMNSLNTQMRRLFDEELLKNNPNNQSLDLLETEVEDYKKKKITIKSYVIQGNDEIKKSKVDGKDYAIIVAGYIMKGKGEDKRTYEEFILRQDEQKKWKILGWKLTEPIEIKEE